MLSKQMVFLWGSTESGKALWKIYS